MYEDYHLIVRANGKGRIWNFIIITMAAKTLRLLNGIERAEKN